MVKGGTKQMGVYTHYNLLATIEKNFGLGNLGRNDATAAPFDCLWDVWPYNGPPGELSTAGGGKGSRCLRPGARAHT